MKKKIGDEVKWFDDEFSIFPKYGTIIRVNKKTATIKQENGENVRVEYNKLNFD